MTSVPKPLRESFNKLLIGGNCVSECTGECHNGCSGGTCVDDDSKCTGECHNGCSGGNCINDDSKCNDCQECVGGGCELKANVCRECFGYEGWSGGNPDAGEPPNCDDYESTRTLGSCVYTGNPEDSCTENSAFTHHEIDYDLHEPTLEEIAICGGLYTACMLASHGDPYLELQCEIDYANCLLSFTYCVEVSNKYWGYSTGCV